MSTQQVFDTIYLSNEWGYLSGDGSDSKNAGPWLKCVENFLSKKDVTTVLDIGCGDWRLGALYNLKGKKYTGLDISEIAINYVKGNTTQDITFIHGDALSYNWDSVDLILIKDVLQHLPNDTITAIVDKVMAGCKYALICNDIGVHCNTDIGVGKYRTLNLTKDPFNYPFTFTDVYTSGNYLKAINLYERVKS